MTDRNDDPLNREYDAPNALAGVEWPTNWRYDPWHFACAEAVLQRHDRAAARATADAAALAGVTAGDAAVARVAEANGGVVLEVRRQGSEVEVRVRVGDAEATSRAGPGG